MIKLPNVKKIIITLMCVGVLLNENSLFMWSTFAGGSFAKYVVLLRYASLLLMFIYIFAIEKTRAIRLATSRNIVVFFLLTIIATGVIVSHSDLFNINRWITFIYVLCFLLMDEELKNETLNTFIICFIIITAPSIIYWMFDIVGIKIPYSIVQSTHQGKIQAGTYYKSYFLGVLVCNPLRLSRPSGIFDEPGVVGTTAALLLSSILGTNKKKTRIALILIGIFSFSIAFYILIIIISIIHSYMKGALKLTGYLCIVLFAYLIFESIPFESSYLSLIQNRLSFAEGTLVGLNRTYNSFERAFQEFWSAGGKPLIFGYGYYAYYYNPLMYGAAEIRCLIYDIGIIGIILLVVFLIGTIRERNCNKYSWCFLLIFVISMYQRPHILSAMYMLIYILGASLTRQIKESSAVQKRG